MKLTINLKNQGRVLQYAYRELAYFLQQYSNHQVGAFVDADYEILLTCGETGSNDCEPEYKIESGEEDGKKVITIVSSTEKGVLSGVYDLLGRMGMTFTMNGPICNSMLDVAACDGLYVESKPFLRHRGIRQHVNFPMDISSYHIEDAKEYVRNLARMGLNSITFHSYRGQWHAYETALEKVYAGNFFYGQQHVVPDYEVISKSVDNDQYYCIPEIEEQLFDEDARSAFAVKWMNQLMETCKEVGIELTMSIELPEKESLDGLVIIARSVLESYPLLDGIEWISDEGAIGGTPFEIEEIEDKVRDYFGEKAFVNGKLTYIPEKLPEALPGAMGCLKRAMDLYERKDQVLAGFGQKKIAIGLYVACKDTLKFLKNIMVTMLPEDVILTFLPAHGSLAVANNIAAMDFTEAELQRTMIYSWIEFDGNMYLQQNSTKGIEAILKQTAEITGGKPIYGMCFNHWRTAENEVVGAYMAKATAKFETTEAFYKEYSAKMGIGESCIYTEAMKQLEEIDCYNRDNLFNIGFCYLGCWLARPGLSWIRHWKKESILHAKEAYKQVMDKLETCLVDTQMLSGIEHLRFLLNRIRCSILQLNSVYKLVEIAEITDDRRPELLTQEQKDWIEKQCDEATKLCKDYINLHMELLPDRGCQGTVVSYYATMPVYVDHIKQYFVYGETVCTHKPKKFDAPPEPDANYLQ